MNHLEKLLSGGDFRTIGNSNTVVKLIRNENDFDELFTLLFHKDRLGVMRTADAIEKITVNFPQYLNKHKTEIFHLSETVKNKELQWHLALLLSRIDLGKDEFIGAWKILMHWAKDKTNSRIVRVNSMQALFELSKQNKKFTNDFQQLISELQKENIPSINARIRKLNRNII